MKSEARKTAVACVNGGSSSIRFAIFEAARPVRRILEGKIERVGIAGTSLTFEDHLEGKRGACGIAGGDHGSAARHLLDWLGERAAFASVAAIGHRVVHGMARSEPQAVTPALIAQLRRTIPFDPDHLPMEIELIEAFRKRHPSLMQVACFDTAFHHGMPRVARILPVPRRLQAMGVVHYGFHGLSYAFLMEELRRVGTPAQARGRVILAHLGNGASMAAVRHGRSVDTSMGFTPASGLVMGTRTGDLDPGISGFLAQRAGMSSSRFQKMVNHESGLLGVSGTSSDMRDLMLRERSDVRAREAVDLFCYQARKWIGAYAAVLGGLDTLVFAGGIGENSPAIRARICEGLEFLGVRLDGRRNSGNSPVISISRGPVCVRVIRTDEELMIARSVLRILGPSLQKRVKP
jgi:acetate kinase